MQKRLAVLLTFFCLNVAYTLKAAENAMIDMEQISASKRLIALFITRVAVFEAVRQATMDASEGEGGNGALQQAINYLECLAYKAVSETLNGSFPPHSYGKYNPAFTAARQRAIKVAKFLDEDTYKSAYKIAYDEANIAASNAIKNFGEGRDGFRSYTMVSTAYKAANTVMANPHIENVDFYFAPSFKHTLTQISDELPNPFRSFGQFLVFQRENIFGSGDLGILTPEAIRPYLYWVKQYFDVVFPRQALTFASGREDAEALIHLLPHELIDLIIWTFVFLPFQH